MKKEERNLVTTPGKFWKAPLLICMCLISLLVFTGCTSNSVEGTWFRSHKGSEVDKLTVSQSTWELDFFGNPHNGTVSFEGDRCYLLENGIQIAEVYLSDSGDYLLVDATSAPLRQSENDSKIWYNSEMAAKENPYYSLLGL